MDKNNYLQNTFNDINISLSKIQIEQFNLYYELLVEQNKLMNLTAITDYREVVIKHFLDSLALSRIIDLNESLDIIDVGTGAGFPGIPLKIVFPNLNILLLDSLNKRLNFLNQVIESLELSNISTIHGRSEDIGHMDKYREAFDICVSRAVANMSTLSEYCLPFVKDKGSFVAYKTANVNEELKQAEKAIKVLGGKTSIIDSFLLPNTDMDRVLVKVDKISSTPKKYPRNPGKPKRNPIQ